MERYSEYKDSGIKWLGEIPSHWEVMPIKHSYKFTVGWTPPTGRNDLFEGNNLWANISDLGKKEINNTANRISDSAVRLSGRSMSPKGSLLYSFKLSVGTVSFCGADMYTNEAIATFLKGKNSLEYLYYAAPIFIIKNANTNIYGAPILNQDLIKNALVLLPPRTEQDAIVRYLDAATSKIDKAIAMQQKMIDLLNERKQIIIQNAVTKGLDENVEMKDSNCKFLGKIPSTWEVCKTLYVLSMPITDGPHTTPQLYDDGIPFVSAEAVSCGNGYIDFSHIRGYISDSFYNECCKKYIPQRDDIYMIKSGATTGRVAIVNTDVKFTIWSPLAVFRVNKKKVLPYFLYYSLQSSYYQLQVQDKWSFGTQQNVGMRMLEKLILCYPSIEEQTKIVAFIKKNVDNFDSAISNCQRQITLLQERKQIIINEVVTGKVKVS